MENTSNIIEIDLSMAMGVFSNGSRRGGWMDGTEWKLYNLLGNGEW